MHIRELDARNDHEVRLVAERMRATLVEVEGEAQGAQLYSMDWLEQRVRWHLDPAQTRAQVAVAVDETGAIVGHTIVRIESPDDAPFGLVSTTYVLPEARQSGLASRLLEHAHRWFRDRGVDTVCTWTSSTNTKLIGLYRKYGYTIVDQGPNDLTGTAMVKLGLHPLPLTGEQPDD